MIHEGEQQKELSMARLELLNFVSVVEHEIEQVIKNGHIDEFDKNRYEEMRDEIRALLANTALGSKEEFQTKKKELTLVCEEIRKRAAFRAQQASQSPERVDNSLTFTSITSRLSQIFWL